MTKNRTRLMAPDTTCWFTGLLMLSTMTHRDGKRLLIAYDEPSTEHLVPVNSRLYHLLGDDKVWQRNKVPALAYVNNSLGSVPVAIKMRVCQSLRRNLYGTVHLTKETIRPAFSPAIKAMIHATIHAEVGAFFVANKRVWTNPLIGPQKDIAMWSLDNPYYTITPEILKERLSLLRILKAENIDFLKERLKVTTISEKMLEAMDADLGMPIS